MNNTESYQYLDSFTEKMVSDYQLKTLNKLMILKNYSNWTSPYVYTISENNYLLTPNVTLLDYGYEYDTMVPSETQVIGWIKTKRNLGHYNFSPSTFENKINGLFNNKKSLLPNLFMTSLIEGEDIERTKKWIQPLKTIKNHEVEVLNNNIFIKSVGSISSETIKEIISIMENYSEFYLVQ
jgi:hypothetical protein